MLEIMFIGVIALAVGFVGLLVHCQVGDRPRS